MGERYKVAYDEQLKVFRILDLKNSSLSLVNDIDEDIPDDHPAMTVLSENMFTSLVAEAINQEILSPSVVGIGADIKGLKEMQAENTELREKIAELETKPVEQAKQALPVSDLKTEKSILKKHAMDILYKMTIAEDINATS
jgi:hypothetical protein